MGVWMDFKDALIILTKVHFYFILTLYTLRNSLHFLFDKKWEKIYTLCRISFFFISI